jgi:hypothetical protein
MEPFPLQYSCHPRPDEATDPNIRLMLEEFQRIDARFIELHNMEVRMGDKIDGHCGALEQHAEEHLVLLESFCSEAEKERGELEKQFGGLKLEVTCLNRFMERECMANLSGPGIFTNSGKLPPDPLSSALKEGVHGCHIDNPSRVYMYGLSVPSAHAPATGMNSTKSPP